MQPKAIFSITSIQLKKFNFEQICTFEEAKGKLHLNQEIGAVYQKEDDSNVCYIYLHVGLAVKQGEEIIYTVDATILGVINISTELNNVPLKNFVAIMYSYLRPMVAQMTVMAKLPPLDLPPANFSDFEVKNFKEIEEEKNK